MQQGNLRILRGCVSAAVHLDDTLFFANPAQKLLSFQTLNVLQHKAIEQMAKFFDAALAYTSQSRMEVSERGYPSVREVPEWGTSCRRGRTNPVSRNLASWARLDGENGALGPQYPERVDQTCQVGAYAEMI